MVLAKFSYQQGIQMLVIRKGVHHHQGRRLAFLHRIEFTRLDALAVIARSAVFDMGLGDLELRDARTKNRLAARSQGGRRNVGCKLTAAVYFSPISCQISRYSAAESSKTIPSLGPIVAQTPSAAQAPSANLYRLQPLNR